MQLQIGTKTHCFRAKYLRSGMLQFNSSFLTMHIYIAGSLCGNNAPYFGILSPDVAQHNAPYQQPHASLWQEKCTQLIRSRISVNFNLLTACYSAFVQQQQNYTC